MALWCDFLLQLCIIATLVVIGTNSHQCNVVDANSGYIMTPENQFIEYGRPVEIHCVLDKDFVEKNGQSASSRLTFLEASRGTIDIINSSAIKFRVEKPPPNLNWYICLLDTEKTVCITSVTVGKKPKRVDDFKCLSFNWENLKCTWSTQENYVETSYQLSYRLISRVIHWYNCPSPPQKDSNGIMSCIWNVSTVPQYRMVHENFLLNLTAKNRFGVEQMITWYNNFQNVLPAPPEHLKVLQRTSRSLYLQWRIPSSLLNFQPGLHHRILYKCEYGPRKWKLAAIIGSHKEKMNFNLTRLAHANAMCNIKVALRSGTALPNDESMWSANATVNKRLGTDVPSAPPKTTPGCFEALTGNDMVDIYVYWQQIPRKLHNGPKFRYNISIEGEPDIRPEKITKTYAKFENLPQSKNYTFKIWSENDDGPSTRASEVKVYSERPMEPSRLTKIDFEDGKYKLEWDAPKQISMKYPLSHYTLFWCNSKKDWPYKCSGYLNWKILPITQTSKEIDVKDKDEIYQFGVSASSYGISSGIVWADRILLYRDLDITKRR